MEIKTIYTPRGCCGVMFLLLSDGSYYKNDPAVSNKFIESSQGEFESYHIASKDLWFDAINNRWGPWREVKESLKKAGKISE